LKLFRAIAMAAIMAAAFVSVAAAQTSAAPEMRDLRRGVQDCAGVTDSTARLACYDQLAVDVNAAPSTFMVPIDRERVQTLQRESFGFNLPSLSRLLPDFSSHDDDNNAPAEVESLQLQVDRVINRPDGTHRFVMNNGQTWVQVEAQRANNVRTGDTVTVRRAMLGSFLLIPSRGGAAHRVRRED
jgi:hypothetical protein